jgi:hypothetical protein
MVLIQPVEPAHSLPIFASRVNEGRTGCLKRRGFVRNPTKGNSSRAKKAVLATVLVIVFQGTEKVGIYDDQPAASAAL